MTNSKKTSEGKKDVLRDPNHSFDGIQEYDNDMPRWWVNLFIVTVIFSFFYMAWYHLPLFPSQSLDESFEASLATHKQQQQAMAQGAAQSGGEGTEAPATWRDLAQNAALVAEGKTVYETNCVACHGAGGEGLVGPNLSDDSWIHDATVDNLFRIVMEGVAEKGMPPWGPVIGPQASRASLAYIATFQGTNPANAKAAEGTRQVLE
jgi:cytochrome c oxidase cbb3-type subunit 3